MSERWAIETHELVKRYGRIEAVRRLNLKVQSGRITGLLGRNGAGKSTTIRMLLGISRPTAGDGLLLGRSITQPSATVEARRHVAYVAEDKQTYGYMTVRQMIAFTRSFYADWRPDVERRLLTQYDLPLDRKVKALSKGMRTKLALLLALARQPELLILDEPSEGLDPVSIEELLQLIVTAAADGTTVFFSSHQIAEVERIADHVCIVDRGALALDVSLESVRQHYRRISLGFTEEPPRLDLAGEGIQWCRAAGRQVTVMATAHADQVIARARDLGAVSVDTAPITLRELFLETVSEEPR